MALDVLTDICDDHVIWWPKRGRREWVWTLCTVVMTHIDLCTCIALTKWDGPIACVNITENVENFQSKFHHFDTTQTSVTVSVKQDEHESYPLHFSVDIKEIKTITQSLPSTWAISLQSRQSDRHKGEIETPQLSGTMNFSNTNLDVFFPKMYGILDRHLRDDAKKGPKLTQDGVLNMSSWYKPRLTFTAVGF